MIRFVVALGSEARPLIEHFALSPREGSFRWYQSEAASLVVSGIGTSAAATAYLHAKTSEKKHAVWLNVGIAGHRDRAPGALLRAHTIANAATGDCFYPTLLGLSHLETARVTTVDAAEAQFLADDLYDMEAYGFYKTAIRFSTTELVQVLKIVSDNRETGTEHLTKERVSNLVADHVETIYDVTKHLRELMPLRKTDDLEPFLCAWRFSTTQARNLRRLLERLRAFEPEDAVTPARFEKSRTAADVLQELENRVRTLALGQRGY